MSLPVNVLIIALSCGAMWIGANWLVDSAARIARKFGISELVIGLTVVAFGTSAPEFAVTVGSSIKGLGGIPVANIIGSNIFNIGFILGGCALVRVMDTRRSLVWRDGALLLASTAGLVAAMYNNVLGRVESALLVLVLVGYLIFLFVKREPLEIDEQIPQKPATWKDYPMLLLGLLLVVGGGNFLVDAAVEIAQAAGMSETVIGLTIVAAGTSLPEFAISLIALLKKQHGLSAGNLIGSNIFNTLGVLGVAGMIRPLPVDNTALMSLAGQGALTLLVVIFMWTGKRLTRWEGAILVLVSAGIWFMSFRFGQ